MLQGVQRGRVDHRHRAFHRPIVLRGGGEGRELGSQQGEAEGHSCWAQDLDEEVHSFGSSP